MTPAAIANKGGRSVQVGLIGSGIAASRTPAMHMAEGRAQGLDYRYELIDTAQPVHRDQSLVGLLRLCERRGFDGVNITHPFKSQVLNHLGELSEETARIGAANTVVFRAGRRLGFNTDFSGFRAAFLDDLADERCGCVLLLGAGGAASAVAHALLDLGVRVLSIFDRDKGRAADLACALSAAYPARSITVVPELLKELVAVQDGIVNATPMGMADHPGTSIAPGLLCPHHWVADIVYFPLETELLQHARARGCKVMTGLGMALHQAAGAFQHFTGLSADAARMAAALPELQSPPSTARQHRYV